MQGKHRQSATYISIHAPREGGDNIKRRYLNITVISIHAPREGGDGRARPHERY